MDDDQIQQDALQTLAEVAYVGYDSISESIPRIGEATVRFMQSPDSSDRARAILQFWINLCQQEKQKISQNES